MTQERLGTCERRTWEGAHDGTQKHPESTYCDNWRPLPEPASGTPPDTSTKVLEACQVGDDLADLGHKAGRWENRFVAAIAKELLAARDKLNEFGHVWDGERYVIGKRS